MFAEKIGMVQQRGKLLWSKLGTVLYISQSYCYLWWSASERLKVKMDRKAAHSLPYYFFKWLSIGTRDGNNWHHFLLHTTPSKGQTLGAYTQMLLKRHISKYYIMGVKEVHLIFDQICMEKFNPKDAEQNRRDQNNASTLHNEHIELTPSSTVPLPWQDFINCRICKYNIIRSIGLACVQLGRSFLHDGQKLVLAGCFNNEEARDSAWVLSSDNLVAQPEPIFSTSAAEADCRIW